MSGCLQDAQIVAVLVIWSINAPTKQVWKQKETANKHMLINSNQVENLIFEQQVEDVQPEPETFFMAQNKQISGLQSEITMQEAH